MIVVVDGKEIKCKDVKVKLTTKIEGVNLDLVVSVDKNKITVDDGEIDMNIEYESLYI